MVEIMKKEIFFVYDGDCPVCKRVAQVFKIKEAVGSLNLIDARIDKNHPVIAEIKERGLDLDEGMVINLENNFYHGADALNVMALIGSNSGIFNKINYFIFRSKFLARLFYPLFRCGRNLLLKIRNIKKIN